MEEGEPFAARVGVDEAINQGPLLAETLLRLGCHSALCWLGSSSASPSCSAYATACSSAIDCPSAQATSNSSGGSAARTSGGMRSGSGVAVASDGTHQACSPGRPPPARASGRVPRRGLSSSGLGPSPAGARRPPAAPPGRARDLLAGRPQPGATCRQAAARKPASNRRRPPRGRHAPAPTCPPPGPRRPRPRASPCHRSPSPPPRRPG